MLTLLKCCLFTKILLLMLSAGSSINRVWSMTLNESEKYSHYGDSSSFKNKRDSLSEFMISECSAALHWSIMLNEFRDEDNVVVGGSNCLKFRMQKRWITTTIWIYCIIRRRLPLNWVLWSWEGGSRLQFQRWQSIFNFSLQENFFNIFVNQFTNPCFLNLSVKF